MLILNLLIFLGVVEMDNKEKAEYTSMPDMNCGS